MKDLVFATGNQDKFKSAQLVLEPLGFRLRKVHVEVDEIQGEDELIITRDKAEKTYRQLGKPVLVNDDTWSIPGLNGFPGPYMKSVTHWFTPDDFLRLTRDLKDRRVFLTQVAVYQDEHEQQIFTKQLEGSLRTEATDYPGPSWSNVCSMTKDGRSLAEVRTKNHQQLVDEHDTVWNDVAAWLKENR